MFDRTVGYLPDDILVKVDRASMAFGLEVRAPLLDHRLFELATRLPLEMKVLDGQGKRALQAALHRHVPAELVDRPKRGFTVPIGDWLRSDLREWAEELLDERRLRAEGFLDPEPIRSRWLDHQAGQQPGAGLLWNVLVFQAWLENEPSRSLT